MTVTRVPSSPQFRAKQLEKFRELAPTVDIVITTALIPGRDAPKLWLADMVATMKTGSVIVDLAAERGGNCELTVPNQRVVSDNGVVIIGYTDFPSRMAAQSSMLYANNVRHMIADLSPAKDGKIVHNMADDVIRGATAVFDGAITYPPPPPKIQAIGTHKPPDKPKDLTPRRKADSGGGSIQGGDPRSVALLVLGGGLTLLMGLFAPPVFMSHFIVFALACFVGFQVIWGVSHALHTPLMSVTNAISGIIVIGALLQLRGAGVVVTALAAIAIAVATINIVGGFLVTRRMLNMFQRS